MASKVDLSEFYKLSRPRKPPCRVGHATSELDEAESAQLTAALGADKGLITASAIEQWLKARGHTVSINAIASHRKGTCTCSDD